MTKENKGLTKNGNRNNETPAAKAENPAVAFMHWEMKNKEGIVILKDDKGIALFQNPKYQSDAEDALIGLLERRPEGEMTVEMTVTLRLNKKKNTIAPLKDLEKELF